MKIRWLESHTWEIVRGAEATTGEPIIGRIQFNAGEEAEVLHIAENHGFRTATIQLKDGSVLFGVPREIFVKS